MLRSCALLTLALAAFAADPSSTLPFDTGWRFALGDPAGAEQPAFDDAQWRSLSVPHDWSVEPGAFDEKNPAGGAGAFLPAGTGWYRKRFTLPAAAKGLRAAIEFDGVMANSDVWINGVHLGHRPFGYASFRYDLTPHLRSGENVLAVRADNSKQPASRWYAGAGIYRHVRLLLLAPVHLAQWTAFVTTPAITRERAAVHITGELENQSTSASTPRVRVTLFAPDGRRSATLETQPIAVEAGQRAPFSADLSVANPQLWNLDSPALYRAQIEIIDGDSQSIAFGIRDARFEAATGFWLNGRNLKIKGVCLHHDAGALGAAVPLAAWERRLTALKRIGVNAIRTAHNPVAPEFLDLCDRLGLLVMDEFFDTWLYAKNPYDYHLFFDEWSSRDTRDLVMRDRNHPSIILYSAGNEIRDTPKAGLAKQILGRLLDVFHQADPTRPVTQALFRPNVSHDYDNGLADMLDVVGQNYRENEIAKAHADKPTRKIIGTENGHDRLVWLALRDNPALAGQFLWTGIDYLGESRRWPLVAAGSGLLDRTGAMKPQGYERQSWWSDTPMVYAVRRVLSARATPSDPGFDPLERRQGVFPDWSPSDRTAHEETVEVYSNCDEVELFLNGRSLGTQKLPADASPRAWKAAFEPGLLRAVAKNGSHVVATHELRTAGPAAKVLLTAERESLNVTWDDVVYLTASVVDAKGVPVPDAAIPVEFTVAGSGALVAVDSADNTSHEPFRAATRTTARGTAVAIVRATGAGAITVGVRAKTLTGSHVLLNATVK